MSSRESNHRINRRQFVRGVAASSLAAPFIVSSGSLAAARFAPSDRITLGFIGMGKMNLGHLRRFLRTEDVQVLAVCDVDTTRREHAQKTADEHYGGENKSGSGGGCAAYIDHRELLARDDIDAVVIATPDHWHGIEVIDACAAGKDIYCEKPLSLTIHEAKQMIDAVRKHERVFQTGSQQRSSNEFRKACELVRSGRIGKLQEVHVDVGPPSRPCDLPEEEMEPGLDWERWLGPAPMRAYNEILSPRGVHDHFPSWREYREYSGGMMTDWGAHHFDIAQWGLGMDESGPVEITPPDDPAAGRGVTYLYESGVPVTHRDSGGVKFIGTDGQIVVNRGKLESTPASIIEEPLGDDDVHLYNSPGHHRDWINCIRSRKRPICDVEVGARSVTVCHLGNLAYWNGRKLRWDPQKWEFPGDEEANGWRDRERRSPYQLPTV